MIELSEETTTLSPVLPNPWLRLATDWPDVHVEHVSLGQRWAETVWRPDRTFIRMNIELTQVQRRAAVTHECEHLDRGRPCGTLRSAIENRVIKATAEYLLPDLEVVAAALAIYDLSSAANELWVPRRILIDRLNDLTDEQSRTVHARRLQIEEGLQ